MKPVYIIFIAVFIAVYLLLNYYSGLRIWQTVYGLVHLPPKRIFWPVFWAVALSYFLGRLTERFLPGTLIKVLDIAGSYWLAALMYSLALFAVLDLIRFTGKVFHAAQNPDRGFLYGNFPGAVIILITAAFLIYGTWNALNPRLNHYDINIGKNAGSIDRLHIVMVSDIHLGVIVGESRLEKLVASINSLDPDIVLFAGDMVDEDIGFFKKNDMVETLGKVKAKYGAYAILGNHEYISSKVDEVISYLGDAGIDLQLSGHTHAGQLFPNRLITERVYEKDWGYLKKGSLQVIVSSGYGTWGLPIRTGNTPEIVDILVHFNRTSQSKKQTEVSE